MHDDASLPGGSRKELRGALGKPDTGVGDDQLDTFQATLLEMLEGRAPASPVFLGTLADAGNLPITDTLSQARQPYLGQCATITWCLSWDLVSSRKSPSSRT